MARWFVRGLGLALGLAVVFALSSGFLMAGRVLFLVFIAVLLAAGLEPLIGSMRQRLPVGRGAAILVVYFGFFALVVAIAALVVPGALNQFADLGQRLPAFLDSADQWAAQVQPRALGTSVSALVGAARRALVAEAPDPDAEDVVEAGAVAAEVVISVVSLLAIVFFWLTEHARLQRYALAFVPYSRRAGARQTWNEIETRLGSWVRGQLILMGTMGVATTIAYTVIGLDSPILLGLIAGIAEAIPIVGPLIGAIPALLIALTKGPETLVLVALVYIVIQFVEGNVLVPLVMRNTIGISPFLVITSLLIGSAIGGIAGALLAVPVVAAVEVVLERLQARDAPIAQDPAGVTSPGPDEKATAKGSLPDTPGVRRAGRPGDAPTTLD